jgi:hypothetical protein
MNAYQNLISRLDAFVRKYYANQLLRGTLVLLTSLLAYVLVLSVGEYFLYLPVWIKLPVVFLFLLGSTAAFFFWICIPLAKMFRLGKRISHEQAAQIIGQHFPEVSDRLLNVLQLKEQANAADSKVLIEASIDQKIEKISLVPISQAIDLGKNKKHLKVLLPLLGLALLIIVVAPNLFTEASVRLLQPTKEFVKPAPFQYQFQSLPLQVVRNADFNLKVKLQGALLPAAVYVLIEGSDSRIAMQAEPNHVFSYQFKNCTETIRFRFYAAGYTSAVYQINVLQKPVLTGLCMELNYPSYTGRKQETKEGLSDLIVPAGTTIAWSLKTQYADQAWIQFGLAAPTPLQQKAGIFTFQYRFLCDTNYTILLQNKQSKVLEQMAYQIQVIPDEYPVLQLNAYKDTISGTQVVLNGTAGDDYCISKVQFGYQVLDANNQALRSSSVPIKVHQGTIASFQYYFDIASIGLQPGEQVNYFVEVWDNDGVKGPKSVRSEMMNYKAFNTQQIDSVVHKSAQQIKAGLSNTAKQNEKMQDEMQSMQQKMLQSEQMDWQQKQSLQDIAKLQMQMKNNVAQIKKRFEEQIKQTEQKNLSEDLKSKQDALKEQLDHLLNKELQQMMQQLQEMMQKMNKEQAIQQMQQMQDENKLFAMDMERIQALMQKLEMQMRLEDLAAKMQSLADKQSALRQANDAAKKDNASLKSEQAQLKKELQDVLKKDMKEVQRLNQETKQQQDLAQPEKQGEQAASDMQQSEEQLEQNKNDAASKSQSKAAQHLQEMAAALSQQASGMEAQEIEMNIRAVRQILTNLMRLSFDQEQLIKSVKTTATNQPAYLDNIALQNNLHNNSLLIRDSLFSLSKKLFKLAATINKETNQLEKNMRWAIGALEQRHSMDAATKQQYVMTHTNNLALMLNEILSNLMQEQSQSQKGSGKGKCNKPGGMTPKPGGSGSKQLADIISKQQGLGQSMMKGKDGKPKEGDQSGKQGKSGQQGSSGNQNGGSDGNAQELVRMAQQQAAIRRQLAQLNQLLNSEGNTSIAKDLKDLQEQMDRNETDLVNRKLDAEFYLRQKEILSRMMENEKSLREQEQDDKRSSNSAEEISRPVPSELQQYLQENNQLKEQYKTIPPTLKPYYRQLNEIYFKQVGN